jgi:broad specificity phosphatase PhoE
MARPSGAPRVTVAVTPALGTRSAGDDAAPITIVLVRHAEKDTGRAGADVPLNARGFARAQELARVLGPVRFSRIYTTHWQRNRQTAAAIAARSGDSLTVIDDVGETVKALRAEPAGSTVLVVGHVYSIAPLIEGLTGRPFPVDQPVSYDGLWIVTRTAAGGASLTTLRYGALDEAPEPPPKDAAPR